MSENLELETVPTTSHDDFDWNVDKRNVVKYTDDQRKEYEQLYSGTLKQVNNNEIVKGTVVAITGTDVVLNIGFKSDLFSWCCIYDILFVLYILE